MVSQVNFIISRTRGHVLELEWDQKTAIKSKQIFGFSPAAKKSKISASREDDGKVINMAAPTARGSAASNARRLLDLGTESLSQDHDKPPVWFNNFEVRLEQFLDTKIISKLNDLTTRVSEQDETLTAVTMQVTDLEKQIKSLEADKAHLNSEVDDIENRSRRNNLV